VHRPAHPCLHRGKRMQLRAKQVDPEILVHGDPQEPLADVDDVGCLRNRVGSDVMQLHPIVVHSPRMKRLAGAAKPCSWCRMKLTT
jgi:hypothetical protein